MSDCNAIERILLKYVYGKPHPHLNPLPEGEEISLPSNRRGYIEASSSPNSIVRMGEPTKDSLPFKGRVRVGMGVFSDELKHLAESTATLSKLFTRDRENLPSDYLKDKNLRNAYILYFLQANLYKIHIPLMELARHPANLFMKDRLRILDVGSGPGTAILGILDFFYKYDNKPFLEFVAVDSVAENLRDAEGLFRLYMEGAPPPLNPLPQGEGRIGEQSKGEGAKFIPSHSRGEAGKGWGIFSDAHYSSGSLATVISSIEKIKKIPSGPFDIIVLSNLLSEVAHNDPDRIVKRVRLLKNLLNNFMSDDCSCIIIEPALRETSREMLKVRDAMIEAGFHLYSPCLMNSPCPALDNPKDWCHEDIPWEPAELIKKIDNLTGLCKDSIKFSYLVIRKDALSIEDLYCETPMSGANRFPSPLRGEGQGGGELWRFSHKDIFRIVSEPLISKGKIEFYICGRNGRNLIVRLDKDQSSVNKVYNELNRGDIILCRGLIVEEKRIKVNKETEIEKIERHRITI